jgi:serine/threonine-protein kinase
VHHAKHKLAARVTGTLSRGAGATPLPPELLRESCTRVAIAGWVTVGLWGYALFMNEVLFRLLRQSAPHWRVTWEQVGLPLSIVGLVLSVALALVASRWRERPGAVLWLAQIHEVVTCALIASMTWWGNITLQGGRLSWVCSVILVYASIVPTTPRRTFYVSLAAASTETVAIWIASLRGVIPPGATGFEIVWHIVPQYICAVLAVIPSKIIRKLGQQVTRARELGSYTLGERIGRGGMGEVYRATHRMLARPAAVKLIRPETLGESSPEGAALAIERFRREADAAAALQSPHTIQLYDFGVTEEGTFFHVMEYLDGLDLETLVERFGPQPPERVAEILAQACHSLAEAHARGMIHRDIKPSNLFLCRMGLEVDFLKVLDFGLVKLGPQAARAELQVTAAHLTTGTPAFMAPEIASGSAAADHRVDLYALGCVGYWLLTGRLVFDADNAMQMVVRHVSEAPVPPSERSEFDVPRDLDALVLACLSKRPEDRPADAGDLARRLRGIAFAQSWTAERARHWWESYLPDGAVPAPAAISEHPTAIIAHAE